MFHWAPNIDEELDRKEEIEICDTDVHLLEWTMNEVLKPQPTTSPLQEQLTSVQDNLIYPHIIAALMAPSETNSTIPTLHSPSSIIPITYPFTPTRLVAPLRCITNSLRRGGLFL